jgi:hypothetical protein
VFKPVFIRWENPMLTSFAFITFFGIWFIAPLIWLYNSWTRVRKTPNHANGLGFIGTIIGAAGLEFLLFMVLALMNAITYKGIWNWKFWFS